MVSALPARWVMPHSRYNGLSEALLAQKDYVILSRVAQRGVDMFTKRYGRSQFLFLHGHPEYGSEILLREYSRDIRRFISGQSRIYPKQPEHYFDAASHAAFAALQARVRAATSEAFVHELEQVAPKLLCDGWRHVAEQIYTQWLSQIGARMGAYAALSA
jgi:homoserine O-succinyltransferase